MIENRRGLDIFSHTLLVLGVLTILFPLSTALALSLADLYHPDAAGRGANFSHGAGDRRSQPARQLQRPDAAADGFRHRDLLFRQFFLSLPDELLEAARIDGASALRFFWDIVLPLSKTNLAALFVITFIYGCNQYLWPLLIVNDASLSTVVAGIKSMISTSGSPTQCASAWRWDAPPCASRRCFCSTSR
nr:L-arabinose transport system permease protein AraQ [Candidatus Pantoea persica]